ncbi:MAG: hypothetical protein N2255_05575 [Kiritimatiellae bacterium]|nr:hypothetical protein [Kiritimatiellia bacterium]
MENGPFMEAVAKICQKDPRYRPDAYLFVRDALDFTVKALNKPAQGPARHVTGQELLEGIRRYALQEYGPMTSTVLRSWGIRRTEDFGEIVFNLVEAGKLGKTERDKKEDFANGYDFYEAFVRPFLPKQPLRELGAKPKRKRAKRGEHNSHRKEGANG